MLKVSRAKAQAALKQLQVSSFKAQGSRNFFNYLVDIIPMISYISNRGNGVGLTSQLPLEVRVTEFPNILNRERL
jgi:hypothetical protein